MHPDNEEKIAFITESDTYSYKAMPFRLKNARVTYQRTVNRIFKNQLGRIMKGHVDNMLVKSMTFE
jgi:hypothetical protein